MSDIAPIPYRIFVSYRRADSPGHVGWLVECLKHVAPGVEVFRDAVAIEPGVDWETKIREAVGGCDMFVCVIGPQWLRLLEEKRAAGSRDVAAEEVRLALEAARTGSRVLVPAVVAGAEVPTPNDFPDELRAVLRHNVLVLENDDWYENLEPLLAKIRSEHSAKRRQWPRSLNRLTGREIAQRSWGLKNPPILMGRRGGLGGTDMQKDLNEGLWANQMYEAAYEDGDIKANWFYVRDFISELQKRNAYPPVT